MSVKSGQAVTVLFSTANASTGAAADATGTPAGTLYVNGTADAATVTVTNITTGVYKAAVTLPALTAGDVVSLRIAATVATIAAEGVVWQEVADTERVSDLNDPTAATIADAVWDEASTGHTDAGKAGVAVFTSVPAILADTGTDGVVLAADAITSAKIADDAISAEHLATGALTADAFAADAIAAAAVKADAVTKIQSGLATATALTTVDDLVDDLETRLTAARAGYLDNLSAGAVATATAVSALPTAAQNADAVWDELSTGHTDTGKAGARLWTDIASILDDTGTAGVIVASLATDAISAAALSTAAAQEIADAILTRDWTAVTGEAARSALNALRFLRNKWSISGTTLTVTKEDDSASAWTATLTTAASTDGITAVDPA